MAWQARHRFARISASKARPIVDLIRGRDVQDALDILKFSPQRAAAMVSKVLTSAVANADEAEADVDRLFVQDARVDEGPTMPRVWLRGRGRRDLIRKRSSHITVVVEED